MSSQVDLQELAYERSAPAASAGAPRRPIVSRYVVPAVILFGFLGMIAWAARDYFFSRVPVTVVPVVVGRADVKAAGTPLFQAAGWVEPRPTAVLVSALADGVVAELLVVEGQVVDAGEPIARLINIDSKLALRQAESELKLREADVAAAKAQHVAAQQRLKQPLHLQAALADAESMLSKTETELSKIPYLLKASQSRAEAALRNKEAKESLDGVIAGRLIQQAKSEYEVAIAEADELRQRKPSLEKEKTTLERKRDALQQQLSLLTDETRQAAEAEALLEAAKSRYDQARVAVEQASLQLERMTVKAPIAGRVLALLVRPGSHVSINGGATPGTDERPRAIVSMYDPKHLQVRADVRLEDVPLVQAGQPVEITTASAQKPIRGAVLRPTSVANIQKNTLEVKVAIENPPSEIRPEMLVTAEFIAPESPTESKPEQTQQNVMLVPKSLVQTEAGGASIWIAGADGLAHRVPIQLGGESAGQLVEVTEGLTPTDKLITSGRETLQEGDRIEIAGEDQSLGIEARE